MKPNRANGMPRIADHAWHGPIGGAIRTIAPTTEADPVAILATTLALFGALIGDGPHVKVGGVRHPARVWPLIVGRTAAGRKGTSWHESRLFVSSFNPYSAAYLDTRVVSGLSTGEGLIAALSAGEAEDSLAPDGRLFVLEQEFARVLAATKRDGATLAPILRGLWDDGRAGVLTRANPLSCDGAHVGMVAHVTPRELRLKLSESDVAGGTVNRFLPVLVERPHLLAHEPAREADLTLLAQNLGSVVDSSRLAKARRYERNKSANRLWTDAYAAMAADEPDGLLGAVLARGPAQTMRLALLYALADGADRVDDEHLWAALALWKYAADSARLLFGDVSGSGDLDRLCDYLARSPGGRTRTEISSLFARNKPSDEVSALLVELENDGDVKSEQDKSKPGRPVTRFHWTGTPRDRLGELLAGIPTDEINELTN